MCGGAEPLSANVSMVPCGFVTRTGPQLDATATAWSNRHEISACATHRATVTRKPAGVGCSVSTPIRHGLRGRDPPSPLSPLPPPAVVAAELPACCCHANGTSEAWRRECGPAQKRYVASQSAHAAADSWHQPPRPSRGVAVQTSQLATPGSKQQRPCAEGGGGGDGDGGSRC